MWVNHGEKQAVSVGALREMGAPTPQEVKNFPGRLATEWYARYFPVMSGRQGVNEFLDELGADLDAKLDAISDEVKKGLDVPPEEAT